MNFEFTLILILPWLLDLAGGRSVLASIFGALLWGAAVAVAYARRRTKDPIFKTRLGFLLGVLCGSWFTYWALCFTGPAPLYFESRSLKWLTLLHAGLLAAGFGMVLVMGIASMLWLARDLFLKQDSWQKRRFQFLKKLPSLESLGRTAEGAASLAFSSWGFGLLLAFLAALMHWKVGKETVVSHSVSWAQDPRILLTALLWVFLSVAYRLRFRVPSGNPWLYRGYLILAIVFLFYFSQLLPGHENSFHEPIEWFVR